MKQINYLKPGRLNIGFIDLSFGSSGKGKFNSLLANREVPDFAVSQNSVNASHVIVRDDGSSYKYAHLPSSTECPTTKLVMGAGASIDLTKMLQEIEDHKLTPERLFIHPNAVVITPEDIEFEKEYLARIASTMTGNGAAAGRKVMRHPGAKMASDYEELAPFIKDTTALIATWLRDGETGVLETAQGWDLSLDHGVLYSSPSGIHKAYPHCTSRNVDPLTFAGLTGAPAKLLGNIFMNIRAFPIRVGDGSNCEVDGLNGISLAGSSSGPIWPDQEELDWEKDLGIDAEITSLTKRKRRVFSFSDMQLYAGTRMCMPDYITINFVNYVDKDIEGVFGQFTRTKLSHTFPRVAELVNRVEANQAWANTPYAGRVIWLGTGPKESQYIELID
jgi:adenylosuccinate synthase